MKYHMFIGILIVLSQHLKAASQEVFLYPSKVGFVENLFNKDYDHNLIKNSHDLNLESLRKGVSFAQYHLLNSKEFIDKYKNIPHITNFFQTKNSLVTSFSGIFLTEHLPSFFFTSKYQLSKEFIEKICRKLIVSKEFLNVLSIAHRPVKHGIPLLPKIYLQLKIKVAVYDFFNKQWTGHPQIRFSIDENDKLNQNILNELENFQPAYLITTSIVGINGPLKNTFFLTTIYKNHNTQKNLFITHQFVNIKVNWLLAKALTFRPNLIQKTVYRDFAKYVDAIRMISEQNDSLNFL